MAKKKQPKPIDNSWLKAEVDALALRGVTQADMSRGTGISADKLNKSLANTRGISLEEYKLIKAFLDTIPQKDHNIYQAKVPDKAHNETVSSTKELTSEESHTMSRDSGLTDEVAKDLLNRVRRLEEKVEELGDTAKSPQRGRKR